MTQRRATLFIVALLTLAAAVLLVAALILIQPPRPGNRLNVLILAVDALRPDRLGCYGATGNPSPAIDSLASQGVMFLNATTQAPATGPSFSTMLTSRYPLIHGVISSALGLQPNQLTLTEALHNAGYQTAAFPGSLVLHRASGLDQGFDTYPELPKGGLPYRDASEINNLLLPWLDTHAGSTFFAFVHYMETHDPYRHHGPDKPYVVEEDYIESVYREQIQLEETELHRIRAAYDSEVTYADQHIRKVLTKLDQLDLRRNTVIILLADHGELLYEHERGFGHFRFLYQETCLVPLIITSPTLPTQDTKVPDVVELRDLAPTILDMLQMGTPSEFEGRSLLALMNGQESDEFVLAYTMREPWSHLPGGPAHALRLGDWKLIHFDDGTDFLFDLSSDPNEQVNLAQKRPDITNSLRDRLLEMVRLQMQRAVTARLPESISEERLEQLRSLGYID